MTFRHRRLRALLLAVAAVLACASLATAGEQVSTGVAPPPPLGPEKSIVQNLFGSSVTFYPAAEGDGCYDAVGTYCFQATSGTTDWEFVYNLWLKFPADWVVTNAYISGTPSCTGGGTFGPFAWSTDGSSNILQIDQNRYQSMTDTCTAVYCVEATSGSRVGDALVSWYWNGDGYEGAPHNPCSSDDFTPAGHIDCDDASGAQPSLSPCYLKLTPEWSNFLGCGASKDVQVTLANNTGSGGNFAISYEVTAGDGMVTGPPLVWADNGGTATFGATLMPGVGADGLVVATLKAKGNGHESPPKTVRMNMVVGFGWMSISPEPDSGRLDNVIASWNGLIWSITGYGANANVRTYNPVANTWSTVGTPPPFGHNYARSGCTSGSKVFMYGDAGTASFTGLWSYDMSSGAWTNETPSGTPPTPTGIWAPAWAKDEATGFCYLTGGATKPGTGDLTSVYVYDPAANAWLAPLPDFTTVRDFHAAYLFPRPSDGHKLLCVAGGNSDNQGLSSTQCYDFTTAVWNAENADLGSLGGTLWGMGYVQTDGDSRLWQVAGILDGTVPTSVSYFDTHRWAWADGGNLTNLGVYRTSAVAHDGTIYNLGGSHTGGIIPTGESQVRFACSEPADLAVDVFASTLAPSKGQAVTFTLHAWNNGPNDQSQVKVVQQLPPGLNYKGNSCGASFSGGSVVWSVGKLEWAASVSCNVTATADAWGALTTTATVSGVGGDPLPENNKDTVAVTVDIRPLLIFEDLFTDGNAAGDGHWMEALGDWSVNRVKNYTSDRLYSNTAVVGSLDGIAAGRIVAKIKLTKSFVRYPNAAIVFAWQDSRHYRYALIRSGKLQIGQVGPLGGQGGGVKLTRAYAFATNKWYTMRADVYADGTVKVYRGAIRMGTFKFAAAVSGKVGLMAGKAVSLFDNFQVFDSVVLPQIE